MPKLFELVHEILDVAIAGTPFIVGGGGTVGMRRVSGSCVAGATSGRGGGAAAAEPAHYEVVEQFRFVCGFEVRGGEFCERGARSEY